MGSLTPRAQWMDVEKKKKKKKVKQVLFVLLQNWGEEMGMGKCVKITNCNVLSVGRYSFSGEVGGASWTRFLYFEVLGK